MATRAVILHCLVIPAKRRPVVDTVAETHCGMHPVEPCALRDAALAVKP